MEAQLNEDALELAGRVADFTDRHQQERTVGGTHRRVGRCLGRRGPDVRLLGTGLRHLDLA
jgi:hypothetical protein